MPPPEENRNDELPIISGTKEKAKLDQEQGSPDASYLRLLKDEFRTPGLSLLKRYLVSKNGNKKTEENCINEFAQNHPREFRIIFGIDYILQKIYLLVVLFVVGRGLGIIDFFIS